MTQTRLSFLAIVAVGLCLPSLAPQLRSQTLTLEPKQVWELEQAYWRYTKAGDIDGYLTLWHADFVGWSCGQPQPGRKAGVGGLVRDVREGRRRIAYEIRPLASQLFGDVAVVHYAAEVASEYADGRRAKETQKITHTWLRGSEGWRIIGGMCAPL